MTVFFGALITVSALLGLVFVATLGLPWRSANPAMAWLQSMLAWAAIAFDTVLLLAVFRVHVPTWIVAAILLGQDAAFAWRLWLLLKVQRG